MNLRVTGVHSDNCVQDVAGLRFNKNRLIAKRKLKLFGYNIL